MKGISKMIKYELGKMNSFKRWIFTCRINESKLKYKTRLLFYKVGTKLNVNWNLNKKARK